MKPLWQSYLSEAANYAAESLRARTVEGRADWREKAEWALAEAWKRRT